jgi:hypothetical protein
MAKATKDGSGNEVFNVIAKTTGEYSLDNFCLVPGF